MRMGLGGWKEREWLLVGGRPACEPCERLQQDLCCIHGGAHGVTGQASLEHVLLCDSPELEVWALMGTTGMCTFFKAQ